MKIWKEKVRTMLLRWWFRPALQIHSPPSRSQGFVGSTSWRVKKCKKWGNIVQSIITNTHWFANTVLKQFPHMVFLLSLLCLTHIVGGCSILLRWKQTLQLHLITIVNVESTTLIHSQYFRWQRMKSSSIWKQVILSTWFAWGGTESHSLLAWFDILRSCGYKLMFTPLHTCSISY